MVLSAGLFGLVIALFGWFLSGDFSDRIASKWGRLNLWLQRVICGLSYRIEGTENLPAGPCIIMAKHQSTWETIGLRGLLPPAQSWILKQELMRLPLFGIGLRLCKSIPIDRSAGRRAVVKVVEQGMARLAEGRYVVIFPEGTRTAPGQRRKYGIGGAVLAERSGVPVVPIAHNAGVFWRRRGVKKYPGEVQVAIGSAIGTDGRNAHEIIKLVETWIEDRVAAMPGEA
jgi:1-acyl-sn-glycerol-3-phosphate acyltransferase